jgi:putative spermidine/putrescine transport system substrate-binding protein
MHNVFKSTLVSAVVAATFAVGSAQAEDQTLTIVSWGGAYTISQQKAYDEPFLADHAGVKIINEDKSGEGLAGIRAQAAAGSISWDIVDMLPSDAQVACDEGLLEEIDPETWLAAAADGTPASEDFIEGTLGECFVPSILYSTLFAFNKEAFPDGGPQTIADIWDTKKFPGKRALQKSAGKNLEWALIADGVAVDKVYELLATEAGQDQAFASLDKIKDSVIWWDAGAQPPQMLADGEVTIASAYNGRIFAAQVEENQPFEIMWTNQMFEADGWAVPAGLSEEKLKLVKEYIKFSTDTQRLADQAKYISYGPARNSSSPLVGKHEATGVDMKPHMPTSPENLKTAVKFNDVFWTEYGDTLKERFNAWLTQ